MDKEQRKEMYKDIDIAVDDVLCKHRKLIGIENGDTNLYLEMELEREVGNVVDAMELILDCQANDNSQEKEEDEHMNFENIEPIANIGYSPIVETLIVITEEATTILTSNKDVDRELADRVFKKKEQNAESIQEFYQRYIDWANEFEDTWIKNGEKYEGNSDFFYATAEFTRKKLEEYASQDKEYEIKFRFPVVAQSEDDAFDIVCGKIDGSYSIRDLIEIKEKTE